MQRDRTKYWRRAMTVRWLLGVVTPALVLVVSGLIGNWRDGALPAGVFSMVAQAAAELILHIYLRRNSLSYLLFWWAVPLSVTVWGAGQSPFVASMAGAATIAVAAFWINLRDMTALASVVLYTLAVASFVLVSSFGTWPAAAAAGGVTGLAAAVVYYVGRIFQRYGFVLPLPDALYLAATPVGFLLWGVGLSWQFSALFVVVVGVGGFIVDVSIPEGVDFYEEN